MIFLNANIMKSAIKERTNNELQYIRGNWSGRRGGFEFGDEVFKFTDGIDPVQLAAVVYERGEVRPGGGEQVKDLNAQGVCHFLQGGQGGVSVNGGGEADTVDPHAVGDLLQGHAL